MYAGGNARKTNGTDWFPAMARTYVMYVLAYRRIVDEVAAARGGFQGLSQEAGNTRTR